MEKLRVQTQIKLKVFRSMELPYIAGYINTLTARIDEREERAELRMYRASMYIAPYEFMDAQYLAHTIV